MPITRTNVHVDFGPDIQVVPLQEYFIADDLAVVLCIGEDEPEISLRFSALEDIDRVMEVLLEQRERLEAKLKSRPRLGLVP